MTENGASLAAISSSNHIAYTYAEAARLLSCSKDTVVRLCKSGQLNRIYLNSRSPRVPAASLARYLESQLGQSYDHSRTTASALNGEGVWQKSINDTTRPIGGRRSKTRLVNELDALLASPIETS